MRRRIVSRAIPSFARINALQFRSKRLRASGGSFQLSGQDVDLRLAIGTILAAGSASFQLSGLSASLLKSRVLAAGAAAFALSGQAASFVLGKGLIAGAQAFALTGQAASLLVSRNIAASAGAFALTGQPAGLVQGRVLSAAPTSFALSGQDAGFVLGKGFPAAAGAFDLTGQAAGLLRGQLVSAAASSFALSGQAAGLVVGKSVAADPGAYSLNGQAAGLLVARRVAADAGAYALSGQAATLIEASPGITVVGTAQTMASAGAVALPSGIAAGDTIIVVYGVSSGSLTATGFTEIAEANNPHVLYKMSASGSEGTSLTLSGASRAVNVIVLRGVDTTVPLEYANRTTTLDPPSISPSWGSGTMSGLMALSYTANQTVGIGISTWPTGYTVSQSVAAGDRGGGVYGHMAIALKLASVTSDDPSIYVLNQANGASLNARTIAVKAL